MAVITYNTYILISGNDNNIKVQASDGIVSITNNVGWNIRFIILGE